MNSNCKLNTVGTFSKKYQSRTPLGSTKKVKYENFRDTPIALFYCCRKMNIEKFRGKHVWNPKLQFFNDTPTFLYFAKSLKFFVAKSIVMIFFGTVRNKLSQLTMKYNKIFQKPVDFQTPKTSLPTKYFERYEWQQFDPHRLVSK